MRGRQAGRVGASRTRFPASGELHLPEYEVGSKEATRKAYGDALVALGAARGDVVALDGEVGNSTYSEEFAAAYPERFIQCYIAEQQMVAMAVGLQVRGWRPFAATFAAFLSRAYDFVRMAAVSRANIVLTGSHAGVSIGEDGPSQMALEDIASMRAVFGSTVLYPSDANQTAALLAKVLHREGIVFIRTTREKTAGPLSVDRAIRDRRQPGRAPDRCRPVTLVGAGITLHEAIKAADALAERGDRARVIDCYSVKPIDAATLRAAARETGGIITVEDHWPEGGLGDAVLEVFAADAGPPTDRQAGGPPHARVGDAGRAAGDGRDRCRSHRRRRPRPRTGEPMHEHAAAAPRRAGPEPVDRFHRP